jgi:hypothetical protein
MILVKLTMTDCEEFYDEWVLMSFTETMQVIEDFNQGRYHPDAYFMLRYMTEYAVHDVFIIRDTDYKAVDLFYDSSNWIGQEEIHETMGEIA